MITVQFLPLMLHCAGTKAGDAESAGVLFQTGADCCVSRICAHIYRPTRIVDNKYQWWRECIPVQAHFNKIEPRNCTTIADGFITCTKTWDIEIIEINVQQCLHWNKRLTNHKQRAVQLLVAFFLLQLHQVHLEVHQDHLQVHQEHLQVQLILQVGHPRIWNADAWRDVTLMKTQISNCFQNLPNFFFCSIPYPWLQAPCSSAGTYNHYTKYVSLCFALWFCHHALLNACIFSEICITWRGLSLGGHILFFTLFKICPTCLFK